MRLPTDIGRARRRWNPANNNPANNNPANNNPANNNPANNKPSSDVDTGVGVFGL